MLIFLIIVAISLIGIPIILGYSEIYCVHTDIDINSGDIRHIRYMVFIPVSEKYVQTSFSKLVRKFKKLRHEPDWKRVNTRGTLFRRVFPYPEFHGAINACESFVELINVYNIPEAEQRQLVGEYLNYLKEGRINQFEDKLQVIGKNK